METKKTLNNRRYRGMHVDTNAWVDGYLLPHPISQYLAIIDYIEKEDRAFPLRTEWSVYYNSVGQCLNLKDMNDKDIYEGDFIKRDYPFEGTYLVMWSEKQKKFFFANMDFPQMQFYLNIQDFNSTEFEIVGNLYENPEMYKNESFKDF